MRSDRRRVRGLLLAVFVPVLIIAGVLASAVLGQNGSPAEVPTPLPRPLAPLRPPAAVQAPTAPPTSPAPAPLPAPAPPPPPPAGAGASCSGASGSVRRACAPAQPGRRTRGHG